MICCQKERTTKFCPDCGALLAGTDPLDTLMAHCRSQENLKAQELARAEKDLERERHRADKLDLVRAERELRMAQARHARWKSWVEALAEVILTAEGKAKQGAQ